MPNPNTIKLVLVLSVLVALLPVIAHAAPLTVDSDPATLVDALWLSWGDWPYFVGAAVALLIQAWRTYQPVVFESLSPVLKRVIPLGVAGLTAFAAALLIGSGFVLALKAATVSWGVSLIGGDLLRAVLGRPTTLSTTAE